MEFRVNSLKGCIGIGVLKKEIVTRNQYKFLTDDVDINHGGYMLLSNGYQYSHHSKRDNFK